MIACGLAVLSDRSTNPMFPRWYGFFSVWIGVVLMAGFLVPFQGPGTDLKNGTNNPAMRTTPIHNEKKPYHRGNIGFVTRTDRTARPHAIIWIRAGATG